MRKILTGAVLALCFLMISLTLVGKTLPRATGPAQTSAKEVPPDNLLALAAAVTVARVAPSNFTARVLAPSCRPRRGSWRRRTPSSGPSR